MLSLTLLRHGAVDQRPFVLWGQMDPPVSAAGRAAMAQAIANPPEPWAGILSSPLRRCRAFAQQQAKKHGRECRVLEGLREMDFGRWQGLTPAEAMERDATLYAAFQSDPETQAPPGGESLPVFRARVLDSVARWRATRPDGHWLCVTHGGVIRVLLMEWLGLREHWRIALPCAGTLRWVLPEDGGPVLLSLNPPCAE